MFRRRRQDPEHVFYVAMGEGVRIPFCRLDEATTYATTMNYFKSIGTRVSIEPVETCTWCAWCGWRIGTCSGKDLLGYHSPDLCRSLRYDLTVSAITTVGTLSYLAVERGGEMDVHDDEMQEAAEAWALEMPAIEIATWLARRRQESDDDEEGEIF